MIKVESEGEAVDGVAPISSRKDFARWGSLMLERAPVGILNKMEVLSVPEI